MTRIVSLLLWNVQDSPWNACNEVPELYGSSFYRNHSYELCSSGRPSTCQLFWVRELIEEVFDRQIKEIKDLCKRTCKPDIPVKAHTADHKAIPISMTEAIIRTKTISPISLYTGLLHFFIIASTSASVLKQPSLAADIPPVRHIAATPCMDSESSGWQATPIQL